MEELTATLDGLEALLRDATAMPLSASCMINRGEALARVERIRALLPAALASAQQVLGDRSQVVAAGRLEADRIIAQAQQARLQLLADTDITQEAREEADRILRQAREESDKLRADVDDYIDGKLATFEIVLTKTVAEVERGREKLSGRTDLDALGEPGPRGEDIAPLPH